MKRAFGTAIKAGACAIFALGLFHAGGAVAASNSPVEVDTAYLKLETVKQSYMAAQRQQAVDSNTFGRVAPIDRGTPGDWLKKVEKSTVNMVTNRVEARGQRAIDIEGKRFYVPVGSYEQTFRNNLSLRYSTDPVTGNKVDKSEAVAFADAQGRVFYFETEKTYKNFVSLEGATTFYGVR